jgi:ATP adenylyltransferase
VLGAGGDRQSVDRCASLPFLHALSWRQVGTRADDGHLLLASYHDLLAAVGITTTSQPYNLLISERWMLLVPRSREHFEEVSVNALGFAGSLLVPDHDRLQRVRAVGPMRVLQRVTGPAPPDGG